jgi:NAD(P)-dependent dehydrogenase (short-subunit alcohol dehydrogenase family)
MTPGVPSEERKRTAIVTGSGRGIGKETADQLYSPRN